VHDWPAPECSLARPAGRSVPGNSNHAQYSTTNFFAFATVNDKKTGDQVTADGGFGDVASPKAASRSPAGQAHFKLTEPHPLPIITNVG
jgi:hypothetical protein